MCFDKYVLSTCFGKLYGFPLFGCSHFVYFAIIFFYSILSSPFSFTVFFRPFCLLPFRLLISYPKDGIYTFKQLSFRNHCTVMASVHYLAICVK